MVALFYVLNPIKIKSTFTLSILIFFVLERTNDVKEKIFRVKPQIPLKTGGRYFLKT